MQTAISLVKKRARDQKLKSNQTSYTVTLECCLFHFPRFLFFCNLGTTHKEQTLNSPFLLVLCRYSRRDRLGKFTRLSVVFQWVLVH